MSRNIPYQEWCKDAVRTLEDKSMIIAMEELAELQQAISKGLRGKLDRDNLAEEIADVLIVIDWIAEKFEISLAEVEAWSNHKKRRIAMRVLDGTLD